MITWKKCSRFADGIVPPEKKCLAIQSDSSATCKASKYVCGQYNKFGFAKLIQIRQCYDVF